MILFYLTQFLVASFVLRTIRNLLFQTYLWQLKEYRLDRMRSFLKTSQGRKMIFSPQSLIKWFLITTGISAIFIDYLNPVILFTYLSFWLIWIAEALKGISELTKKAWKLPKVTLKALLIIGVSCFLMFGWFYVEDLGFFLTYGPFLDKLLTPIIFINVITVNIFSWFVKKIIVFLAKRKIGMMKNITVIGITGSYGKTSTKEFLYTILSEKYKVIKTEGYNNTEISVALSILKVLKPSHEIFIVEMGAYKKGEIKDICDMVNPKIGVITGINSQHVEMFGTIGNTVKAKFELIKGLQKHGIAIFNLNNKYIQEMYLRTKNERKDLSCLGFSEKISYTVMNVTKDIITFTLIYKDKKIICQAPLYGRQNIENTVAACFTALQLKLTLPEIKKAVNNLRPPVHTMRLFYDKGRNPIIDDTFNSNPDGVVAALEYLSLFKGKKYLVLTPLIELGKEAESIHRLIGERVFKLCDKVYLTNSNYYDCFRGNAEILKGGKLPSDGVILFEGKEAGKILEKYVY